MKTITIKAWQCDGGYKVHFFSNTCQVSIGTILSREQWESAVSHPRANMICTGLEPVEQEENLLIDTPTDVFTSELTVKQDEVARVNGANFEAKPDSTQFEQSRQFDALAAELCVSQGLISDGCLAAATSPDPGDNNLGTVGIQGKIERSNALKTMREQTAKFLGLSPETITSVSARANALPIITQFTKHLLPVNSTEPF